MGDWFITAALILLFVGVIALAVFASIESSKQCAAAGGHLHTMTGSGVGIGSNGSVVPAVTSTTVCLSPDGRILTN